MRPGEIGNAGSSDDTGAHHADVRGFQSRRQDRTDPGARLARVLTNEDASVGVARGQPLPQGASDGEDSLPIERILARNAPNSICPK